MPDERPTSLAVVDAVEAVSGRPASGNGDEGSEPLPPLYDAIDPDALDALCSPRMNDSDAPTTITFPYSGYEVCVETTGRITVVEV